MHATLAGGCAYDRNVPFPEPAIDASLPGPAADAARHRPAWADADTYRLDPVHTRVLFTIDHAGYSQAMGTVSGSEGRLQFDPDNWREATLDVEVPVSRLDLGDAKWNQATLAAAFWTASVSRRHISSPAGSNRSMPGAPT